MRSGKKNYCIALLAQGDEEPRTPPLAAVYLMEYHGEYGIIPKNELPGYGIDTLHIQGPLDLTKLRSLSAFPKKK